MLGWSTVFLVGLGPKPTPRGAWDFLRNIIGFVEWKAWLVISGCFACGKDAKKFGQVLG